MPPNGSPTTAGRCTCVNNREEMARLGRAVPEDLADEAVRSTLLRARLGEPSS